MTFETIEQNKANHIKDYDAAIDGWMRQTKETLNKLVQRIESAQRETMYGSRAKAIGKLSFKSFNNLEKPLNHAIEYDFILDMLKLDTRDQVELTATDYRHFVQDEWDWKSSFILTYSHE